MTFPFSLSDFQNVEKKHTNINIIIILFFLICSEKKFFNPNCFTGKFPQQAFFCIKFPKTCNSGKENDAGVS